MKFDLSVIKDFCDKHKIREFSLFGSAACGELKPDSDIDVLVDFQPDARVSLFDLIEMEYELSDLFNGRKVDLITRKGLERSKNPIRKQGILSGVRQIYVS